MSVSAKKNTRKTVKTAGRKTTAAKQACPRKRKKSGIRNPVRAALLAGILVTVSVMISALIIVIHSSLPADLATPLENVTSMSEPETSPRMGEQPAPVLKTVIPPAAPEPARSVTVQTPPPAPVKPAVPKSPPERSLPSEAAPRREPSPKPELPPPVHKGTVVFVIDDAGNNLTELEPFLRFPGPLTIAVLPGLPYSAEAARRIRAAGKEVILHQPMEAIGGQNPGPGAIYSGMNAGEIRETLRRNLAEVGPVAGMNNHQGSKITSDQQMMETVLYFCREQGIYFLDSRTTAETAAPSAAKNLGMKIGERNIFIDNEQNRVSMNNYINEGFIRAEQRGSVVMIGHTWSPELAPLLAGIYSNQKDQGYTFSTASAHIAGAK